MKIVSRMLMSLVLVSSFLAETEAQRATAGKSVTKAKAGAPAKARSRRVAHPAAETPAEKPGESSTDAKEEVKASQAEAVLPEATPTTPAETSSKPQTPEAATRSEATAKPVETVLDPDAVLREQIEATEIGPERIKLQLKLADQLVNSGNKTAAVAELNSIANVEVFDPAGFYNLGNAFARLGVTDGAINAYRKAIEQRQGSYSRAYNNLGVVLLRTGRWDEASDALLKALKLESFRYAEASYNLGRVYAARGQSDLAVREWRRALAVDSKHSAAAQALANAGTEGRILVQPQSRPPAATTVSGAATPAKTTNVKASMTSRPAKPLTLDQVSFDLLQRARNSSERGNMIDAVDSFRRLLSRQGGYFAPANLEISYALLNLKRFDEAIANLQEVTNRDGDRYPVSYFHLARVYEIKGELKLAEASFQKAADAFGTANVQFLLDISRVREKQGNFKGALEMLEQYVTTLDQQGLKPSWADERLNTLRQKVSRTAN
jgi:tetratricopeptide (TPR) repeat protein